MNNIEDEIQEMNNISHRTRFSELILPTIFLCSILIISIVNLSNFREFYKTAIENLPNDRQTALASIEATYAESFVAKNNYVDLSGSWARLMDQDLYNNVIRLKNGILTNEVDLSQSNILQNVNSLINFNEKLIDLNIPLLFIQVPYKLIDDNDENIPLGFTMQANERVDLFLNVIDDVGISYVDIRENIREQNLNNYELFYNTDNHWTTRTGFWAHTQIVPVINDIIENKDIFEEALDINNYTIELYENTYIGAWANRTGIYYGGVDDIEVMIPNFDTSITREILQTNVNETGNFEVLLHRELLDGQLDTGKYSVYFGGNIAYQYIKNHNINNNTKIFIIHDSFGLTFTPFLSLQYDEVHQFDLRVNNDDGSITEVLNEKLDQIKPDIVIMLVNPSELAHTGVFRFPE